MNAMKKRYSKYIRPLSIVLDLCLIQIVIFSISDPSFLSLSFLFYISVFWFASSFFTSFYRIDRSTNIYRILSLSGSHFAIFFLGYFSYFTLFKEGEIVNNQTRIFITITCLVLSVKILIFYALKSYRAHGKNYRSVIIIGFDDVSQTIIGLFRNKKSLGYNYLGFFSDLQGQQKEFLGPLDSVFSYAKEQEVDEMYCSLSELTDKQIIEFTKIANELGCVIKLIPNANELYNKNVSSQFYDDTLLVLNVKKLPFQQATNHLIKRTFDIVFSFFVLVLILSWLTPLLWVLIKIESRGPALFRQKREGLNGHQFNCFKFRSMRINANSIQKHTSKKDHRVTKLGSFLRKTSLDELPQFYNVLKGDMSVVGPRPHLQSLSAEYQKDVDNYIQRHAVKPGITGLAQVSGYRGEIKRKYEIQNRIRLDIFYIENWSFFLDIKIILQTIFNVFKGEEKAY